MATGKKLFEELKGPYIEAYKKANGKDVELKYINGFVIVGNSKYSKVRAKDLAQMTENLLQAAYQNEFKEWEKKQGAFTEEELKASKEFQDWVGDDFVSLIYNVEKDSKLSPTFIVIHNDGSVLNNITRFFKMNGKIQVSVDLSNKKDSEVYRYLLTKYCK